LDGRSNTCFQALMRAGCLHPGEVGQAAVDRVRVALVPAHDSFGSFTGVERPERHDPGNAIRTQELPIKIRIRRDFRRLLVRAFYLIQVAPLEAHPHPAVDSLRYPYREFPHISVSAS